MKTFLAVVLSTLAITPTAEASRVVNSTSYCLTGTMADGTYTRWGSVAMNGVPFGTKIKIVSRKRFQGRRYFIVRDRIGHSSQLDFWSPTCAGSYRWGRRNVRIKIVRYGR